MQMIKTANGQVKLSLSKAEWLYIGKKAGWGNDDLTKLAGFDWNKFLLHVAAAGLIAVATVAGVKEYRDTQLTNKNRPEFMQFTLNGRDSRLKDAKILYDKTKNADEIIKICNQMAEEFARKHPSSAGATHSLSAELARKVMDAPATTKTGETPPTTSPLPEQGF